MLVAALAALVLVALPATAFGSVSVTRAEVSGGNLRIEGRAVANRSITVDGVAMATSDRSGSFRVSRSSFTSPADRTVDVNDGSATPANARLSGCTVASPPPSTPVSISPNVAEFAANVGTPFLETFVLVGTNVTSPSRFPTRGRRPAGGLR